jgi:hypothetical protein
VNTDSLTLDQLKQQLSVRRITITRINGKLAVSDPAGRLTPLLDCAIRQHRDTLLIDEDSGFPELLRAIKKAVLATDLESLLTRAEAANTAGRITVLEFHSLIVSVAGRAREIPYRFSELRLLLEKDPEQIRAIHAIRTKMDAELVEPDDDGCLEISAEALLGSGTPDNRCYACGQSEWWQHGRRRVCEVCHPNPRKT